MIDEYTLHLFSSSSHPASHIMSDQMSEVSERLCVLYTLDIMSLADVFFIKCHSEGGTHKLLIRLKPSVACIYFQLIL